MNNTLVFVIVAVLSVFEAMSRKVVHVNSTQSQCEVANKKFLKKQMITLQVLIGKQDLKEVNAQYVACDNFDIAANINNYKHTGAVKQFLRYYKKGLIERGEPNSVHDERFKQQLKALIDLLSSAKDNHIFYKTACWVRDKINERIFISAYYDAVLHREDMQGILLPPQYEVYPYFFAENIAIQEAHDLMKMNKTKSSGIGKGDIVNDLMHYMDQQMQGRYELEKLFARSTDHKAVKYPLRTLNNTVRVSESHQFSDSMKNVPMTSKEQPPYTNDELDFIGVKVRILKISKLITYFEHFDNELVLHLNKTENDADLNLMIDITQLNHKPFTYSFEVTSDKAQDVYVRVFLGPMNDNVDRGYNINNLRYCFMEMDHFRYRVKSGRNKIRRNSSDSSVITRNYYSLKTTYQKVKKALEGKTNFCVQKRRNFCGIPENLLLPQGKPQGFNVTFFVIVTRYVEEGVQDFTYCKPDRKYSDAKPYRFPFDREINVEEFFTSNMDFKDETILHDGNWNSAWQFYKLKQ